MGISRSWEEAAGGLWTWENSSSLWADDMHQCQRRWWENVPVMMCSYKSNRGNPETLTLAKKFGIDLPIHTLRYLFDPCCWCTQFLLQLNSTLQIKYYPIFLLYLSLCNSKMAPKFLRFVKREHMYSRPETVIYNIFYHNALVYWMR